MDGIKKEGITVLNKKIYILPQKRTSFTPKHIKRVVDQLEVGRLAVEIKIRAPGVTLDEIIEARISGKIFLLQRLVKCGKGCKKCPHGPYWYGYYKSKGRQVSFYVGKELPKRFIEARKIKILKEIILKDVKREENS